MKIMKNKNKTNVESKKMTTVDVASLGIGSMVGAGIFALLGQVILSAGNSAYFAFLFAGGVALLCGYSYAKLSQVYPQSGGIIEYFKHAFSSRFLAGALSLIYLLTLAVSISMLASSFGIYMTSLLHISQKYLPVFGTAIILILGFVNLKKSGTVGRLETLLVFIKVAVLLALIGFGVYHYFDHTLVVHNNLPATNFWSAVAFAFFAYAGFGVVTNASENVNDPKKTITRALYISLVLVIILYCALSFVILNFVDAAQLHANINTAVSTASNMFMGKYGFIIMSVAGLIAISSGINALIYSSLKIIQSMSDYKELPKIANAKITSRMTFGFLTLIILTSLGCIFLEFGLISKIASATFLISYLGLFISHYRLRHKVHASLILIGVGFASILFILIQMLLN